MKLKKYITILAWAGLSLSLASCDDFLSTTPDNRTDPKTFNYTELRDLLVNAYPESSTALIAETASDNTIGNADALNQSSLFLDEVYAWKHILQTDNEDLQKIWEWHYGSIQHSNLALEAIASKGNPKEYDGLRGEALLTRAYSRFVLVNMFTEPYDPKTAEQKLGIVLENALETTLDPKYKRTNLADSYKAIEKDIEEGLPLINDATYVKGVKYRFNRKAAYAFAARFNLYYQKWDKALEYADIVLGEQPILRDYSKLIALPSAADLTSFFARAEEFASYDNPSNLLLLSVFSSTSAHFSSHPSGARYNHLKYLADNETVFAYAPWGTPKATSYVSEPRATEPPYVKVVVPKFPRQFQITDQRLLQGFVRSTVAEFTTNETLLVRAEAKIHLNKFSEAMKDMNLELANLYKSGEYNPVSEQLIKTWFDRTDYYTAAKPTPKKRLNPSWTISKEQEPYLQALLHLRRIETLHQGLRWFDIKRYGIEITRIEVRDGSNATATSNILTKDDPRRAFQIPEKAIISGIEPNKR